MAAFKVKKLWTAFITAFFAMLASLGLTAPAAAAGGVAQQSAEQPSETLAAQDLVAQDRAAQDRAPKDRAAQVWAARGRITEDRTSWATATRPLMPRDRSLPPTIKQRIHAEAHGSSPLARHLPVAVATDDDVVRATARETARDKAGESAIAPDAALAAA